jgi:hypothetical protein
VSTPVERALALSILAIRLRNFARGEVESVLIEDKDFAARASIAIDELIVLRDDARAMVEVFNAWEFDQRSAEERRAAAKALRATQRERIREREAQLGGSYTTGGAIA